MGKCEKLPQSTGGYNYPLVNCNITMENQHFYWVIQLSMAIFNIYVSLREGHHVCLPNIVFGPHPLHPAMPRQASSGEVSATMVATPLSDVLIGPMQAISHRPLAQHGIFLYIVCIVSSWYFSSWFILGELEQLALDCLYLILSKFHLLAGCGWSKLSVMWEPRDGPVNLGNSQYPSTWIVASCGWS